MMKPERGFTLLEVMVALAVLALTMAALMQASTQQARTQAAVRDSTLATWVAANAIETLRAEEPWPAVGRREGQARMGQQDWFWRMQISQTDATRIRRIDVRVFHRPGAAESVASLSGFVGLQ